LVKGFLTGKAETPIKESVQKCSGLLPESAKEDKEKGGKINPLR